MSYREITITKQLLFSRVGKAQKRYNDLTTTLGTKSSVHRNVLDSLLRIIKTGKLNCGICNKDFGENDIGSKVISSKRRSTTTKKWYCISCARKKNLID